MDTKLVKIYITDNIEPRGLVHSRVRFRKLLMVPSCGGDVDIYGDDIGRNAQEALYVTHNSASEVDDTLVEEGIEKIF